MSTGAPVHYVSGEGHIAIPIADQTHRPMHGHSAQPKPKSTFDWDAHTPACKTCSTKTGALNRFDECASCSPPELAPPPPPTKKERPPKKRAATTMQTDMPSQPMGIKPLLDHARAHDTAKIRNLAGRILDQITNLRELLDEDSEAAQARAEVKRLEEALAAAKAKLPGRRTSAPKVDSPCTEPGCGKTFDTAQGLSLHTRRAHPTN